MSCSSHIFYYLCIINQTFMKRLIFFIGLLFLFATAFAQENKSIIIEQSTFRAVQTDALTGVAVDAIGMDSSRRPCARLKIKIERMTREEINGISLKIISNNQLTKCITAEYENGLIVEMTANKNTRFYFHHDDFGDSNEVALNLEGNKEYYIEARLNVQYPITIASNVQGVNVYLDNQFKGRTNENFVLIVKDVLPGEHQLMVEYGGIKQSQTINVNANSVFFRQAVNTQASKPQYVVLEVVPSNAVVVVDNKYYTPQEGVVTLVLENGSYNYSVTAADYHTKRGTLTVTGAKVEKQITLDPAFGWLDVRGGDLAGANIFVDDKLIGTAPIKSDRLASGEHRVRILKEFYKAHNGTAIIRDNQTTSYSPTLVADFAMVTLEAQGAEIWVNGQKRGVGKWSGRLATGSYLFESRKDGHKSGSLSKSISSSPSQQSYTLPAPIAMVGTLDIQSTPALADIQIDGNNVGRTPIMLDNVLVGLRKVTISKSGYKPKTQTVDIAEGKVVTLNLQLEKQATAALASTTVATGTSATTPSSSRSYKIGDYYNENGKEGVVFEVSANGRSGKIVSLVQTPSMLKWASDSYEQRRNIGATDMHDGSVNMAKVKTIVNWRTKYPAFKWCADLGEGWYLPATQDLKDISRHKSLIEGKLKSKLGENFFFSSTESNTKDGGNACVYDVSMKTGGTLFTRKDYHSYAMAVAKFGGDSVSSSAPTGSYKVGDLYSVNGVQGVVFEVDASGTHGKIVSVRCSGYDQAWALDAEQKRFIGAVDENDGAKNLAVVKSISNWQSKYPAFYWCTQLGAGWYLPAKNEVKAIFANKLLIESKLSHKLNVYLWTSTEANEVYSGQHCSWNASTTGSLATYCKGRENVVFAVYKF